MVHPNFEALKKTVKQRNQARESLQALEKKVQDLEFDAMMSLLKSHNIKVGKTIVSFPSGDSVQYGRVNTFSGKNGYLFLHIDHITNENGHPAPSDMDTQREPIWIPVDDKNPGKPNMQFFEKYKVVDNPPEFMIIKEYQTPINL